jgi:hypothetical protein
MLPVLAVWFAWIAWRRTAWVSGRHRFARVPRGRRVALSVGATILGPAILLGGLVLLDASGAFHGNLSILSLASVTILGLGFIELQMAAVAITGSLVADSVTASRRASSKMEESEEENR